MPCERSLLLSGKSYVTCSSLYIQRSQPTNMSQPNMSQRRRCCWVRTWVLHSPCQQWLKQTDTEGFLTSTQCWGFHRDGLLPCKSFSELFNWPYALMIGWGKYPRFIPILHFKIYLQPEPLQISHPRLNLSESERQWQERLYSTVETLITVFTSVTCGKIKQVHDWRLRDPSTHAAHFLLTLCLGRPEKKHSKKVCPYTFDGLQTHRTLRYVSSYLHNLVFIINERLKEWKKGW